MVSLLQTRRFVVVRFIAHSDITALKINLHATAPDRKKRSPNNFLKRNDPIFLKTYACKLPYSVVKCLKTKQRLHNETRICERNFTGAAIGGSRIQFAADTGYDCVELMCWPKGKAERRYAGVTHVDVAELSDTEADEILQCVSDTGITISGLGYYPNPLTPDAAEAAVYSGTSQKTDSRSRAAIGRHRKYIYR